MTGSSAPGPGPAPGPAPVRRGGPPDPGGRAVVYWMQRAQRGADNPALDAAIEAGNALGLPVVVFFGLTPAYPNANRRHYRFMAEGFADIALQEIAQEKLGLTAEGETLAA